jgi:hypothetical protein
MSTRLNTNLQVQMFFMQSFQKEGIFKKTKHPLIYLKKFHQKVDLPEN